MNIIKNSKQEIYGLNSEQRAIIKEALTFDNPTYKNAKRYSKRGYISIPPYLTYYSEKSARSSEGERKKVLIVPTGVNVPKILDVPYIEIKDERKDLKVKYPSFNLELREDQKKAEREYLSEIKYAIYPKSIIQLPTGKGKSILALHIAQRLKQKTLILVHKDDLVVGWTKDIKLCFGEDFEVGLLKAKSRKVGEQITIATVQTLNRMNEEEFNSYVNQFGFVVQDECLIGKTLISLEDGGVKKIEDIKDLDSILGGNVSNKFKRKSEIYELQTSHSILKGSSTHSTWCVKRGKEHYELSDLECKPLKDITRDYYVPVKVNLPHFQKNTLSMAEARFTALIMCDGHLDSASRRVKVNVQKDRGFYYDIMKKFADIEGVELKYSNDSRENVTFWFTSDLVRDILVVKWGIPTGKKSNILTLPEFLYYAPLNTIKAFIETCFNCGGDLSVSNSGSIRINLTSTSEEFILGISLLLRKFGIVANIQRIKRSYAKHNDVYRLSIGGVFFNKFADIFTLMDRKQTQARNTKTQGKRFVGEFYLSPVKAVSNLGYEDYVYDFTVDNSKHSFIANGVYTHNCHHVGLNIFNIIDKFNSKYKLGLSATPIRNDGLNFVFDLFFSGICYKHEIIKDDKDICDVEVIPIESSAEYKPFYYQGEILNYYDYGIDELPINLDFIENMEYSRRPIVPHLVVDDSAVSNDVTMIKVCNLILKEYYENHSILVLFTQKKHIDLYYEYLRNRIPENQIMKYYGDTNESSEILMKRAESKEVLITLATYAKASEGTNVKSWEVEFLVSSINNGKGVEQVTGRIRRKKDGKLNPVRVYDVQYPRCYGLRRHYATRLSTYKKLLYEIKDSVISKRKLFSRGYNKAGN